MIARVCSSRSGSPTPQAWLSKVLRDELGGLLAFQQDVAQRAEAGTDAVGTLAVGDDTADDGAGVVDPCPGRRRQFQARTVPGHRDQFLPTQRAVAEHDAR